MNLGTIDFGNPEQERAAFFGALQGLGGLGGEELGATSMVPNPLPYPPPGPQGVDFPDPKDPAYTYRANTDGSFRILTAPKGSTAAGKIVSSGTAFESIKRVYLEWAAKQPSPGVAVERASGQTVTPKKKKKKVDAKKAEAAAGTVASIFKGVSEALPGFMSAAAAAGEAPPVEEPVAEEKGWGATQYLLLAGGVLAAGGVAYLLYRNFSASAKVSRAAATETE